MMSVRLKFLLLFFVIIFSSCSQVRYIDIQVLKPSEITPDKPIRQLTILNAPQMAERIIVGADTGIIRLFYNTLYDSIEAKLKGSPALYDARVSISSLAEYRKQYTKTDFNSRKNCYSIDIDSVVLADSVFSDFDLFFDENEQLNSQKLGIHQIVYSIQFAFRNMAFDHMNKRILLMDTIQWVSPINSSSTNLESIKRNKKGHYIELVDNIAVDLAGKVVPNWNMAERQIYFVPNQLMQKAYKYFVSNNLDAAIGQWQTVYNVGTRPLASKAAFNMALSYEIKDNLPASREWINKAIQLKKDSIFIKYQQVIEKRIEERTKIDKQLWQ